MVALEEEEEEKRSTCSNPRSKGGRKKGGDRLVGWLVVGQYYCGGEEEEEEEAMIGKFPAFKRRRRRFRSLTELMDLFSCLSSSCMLRNVFQFSLLGKRKICLIAVGETFFPRALNFGFIRETLWCVYGTSRNITVF